mgnify:CR=1 FL=1
MEFFKIRRDIPFMRHALTFNVISAITFVLAVAFLGIRGLHFSIEFTGGTVIEVSYNEAADVDSIRGALESRGYKDFSVQNFGSSRDVLIRLPVQEQQASSGDIAKAVMESISSASTDVVRTTFSGLTIPAVCAQRTPDSPPNAPAMMNATLPCPKRTNVSCSFFVLL